MAASRIKGITIEIGGDTTKLQTALKGVNTEIKNTQAQLKDVEKLLKLDPGNTELLAQKHKLLGQAVEETKNKLETLKTAQQQADEALKNGTISKDQYDALQREIIETEQELKRLEEQANQSATALQKIAATGEKLKDVGGNIENAGKKLLPVTATVTALGTVSVKTAADFESSMSKVAAVSGATGSDLEALSKKAREMGSKTKFSASEAAEAMNYMAMAGWKTEDMLSGIEGVMNLAAASGEDLATTSDIVTDALTAFGLSAQDSGHFADVLAAASSNANTNVSMMGETFKYAAPIAGALGFSVEDTAEAIGLMANAGIKGSQAGTSLRTIMTNLSGDVKICGQNIGEVTIATTNADGSMRDLSDMLDEVIVNAHLKAIGSFKIDTYAQRSIRGVIRNGYLYLTAYDDMGIYKINVNNPTDVTLIPFGFKSEGKSQTGSGTCANYLFMVNDLIIGWDYQIKPDDTIVQTVGSTRLLNIGTPIFQYKEFCFGWGGNYGSDYRMCFLLTPYLASINNLASAVVKTTDKTMKITYELTEEDA